MVISVCYEVCVNIQSVQLIPWLYQKIKSSIIHLFNIKSFDSLLYYLQIRRNTTWYLLHCISQFAGYDVQFNESGTQYTEKIQVDTDKQTESFKVPAHNDVDGRKILHDLKAVSLSLN